MNLTMSQSAFDTVCNHLSDVDGGFSSDCHVFVLFYMYARRDESGKIKISYIEREFNKKPIQQRAQMLTQILLRALQDRLDPLNWLAGTKLGDFLKKQHLIAGDIMGCLIREKEKTIHHKMLYLRLYRHCYDSNHHTDLTRKTAMEFWNETAEEIKTACAENRLTPELSVFALELTENFPRLEASLDEKQSLLEIACRFGVDVLQVGSDDLIQSSQDRKNSGVVSSQLPAVVIESDKEYVEKRGSDTSTASDVPSVPSLEERMQQLMKQQEMMMQSMHDLEEQVRALNQRLEDRDAGMSELQKANDGLQGKVDGLEEKVTALLGEQTAQCNNGGPPPPRFGFRSNGV